MMRRMMSARIDDVAVSAPVDLVRQEPGSQSRELVHALVAAGGPARLEQHDELRRMRVEAPEEFFAKSLRLGEERDGREGRERIEMVFPALALTEEVGDAIADAECHDGVPRPEAAAHQRGRE